MSGHDEDDKPTVVLDLKALRKQKEEEAKKLEEMAINLEFTATQSVEPTTLEQLNSKEIQGTVLLFDFSGDFLKIAAEMEYW